MNNYPGLENLRLTGCKACELNGPRKTKAIEGQTDAAVNNVTFLWWQVGVITRFSAHKVSFFTGGSHYTTACGLGPTQKLGPMETVLRVPVGSMTGAAQVAAEINRRTSGS